MIEIRALQGASGLLEMVVALRKQVYAPGQARLIVLARFGNGHPAIDGRRSPIRGYVSATRPLAQWPHDTSSRAAVVWTAVTLAVLVAPAVTRDRRTAGD